MHETMKIADIKTAKYNPRIMRGKAYEGLKETIREFGQVETLVVNKDGTLISGHQRLRAMQDLGMTEATVTRVDLDETKEKLLNLTMNNDAIAGTFDDVKLKELLDEVKLEDDDAYARLQLNELEPVLGEHKGKADTSTLADQEDYEAKTDRQLTLIYSQAEYEEIEHKVRALNKYDGEEYPPSHKQMFLKLVEEEYERQRQAR